MKKLRWLSLVLALCLCMGLISGCGSQQTEAAPAEAASSAVASAEAPAQEAESEPAVAEPVEEATAEEASAEAEASEPEEEVAAEPEAAYPFPVTLPLTEEPKEFTFWGTMSSKALPYIESLGEASVFKKMGELTGLYMNATCVSGGAAAEQFPLLVASGDWPDVVTSVSNNYAGGIEGAYAEEFIIGLSDLAEEYMPNYSYLLDENPSYRKGFSTLSGELVTLGSIADETNGFGRGLAVREDWAGEYGSVPETYDELHDFLVWARDEKGAGSALWLDPYGTGGGNNLTGGYDLVISMDSMSGGRPYIVEDGKVVCGLNSENMRDYLTLMHTWYDEGLIYKDFVTTEHSVTNDAAAMDVLTNGGMAVAYISVEDLAIFDGYGVPMQAISDITKNPGDVIGVNDLEPGAGPGGWCITSDVDPDLLPLILEYVDYLATPEGAILASYGVEGEAWNYNDEGEIEYTDMIINYPEDMSWRIIITVYMTDGAPGLFLNRRNEVTYSDKQLAALDLWEQNQDGSLAYPNGATVASDLSEEYSTLMNDIQTYATEMILKFITGQEDINTGWDAYVSHMDSLNIARTTEIMQETYDSYMAR